MHWFYSPVTHLSFGNRFVSSAESTPRAGAVLVSISQLVRASGALPAPLLSLEMCPTFIIEQVWVRTAWMVQVNTMYSSQDVTLRVYQTALNILSFCPVYLTVGSHIFLLWSLLPFAWYVHGLSSGSGPHRCQQVLRGKAEVPAQLKCGWNIV